MKKDRKNREGAAQDGVASKSSELEAQLAEWRDKALRAMAEAENTKRIAATDAKNTVEYAISKFALDMIPFADSIALAIQSMKGKAGEDALAGLSAIARQFEDALARNNIVKIKTVGEKLNPLEHRAITQVASDKFEDGMVALELQPGYKIGDKVIREAMVAVAKK
ncbi:MAG: nucleotide exchange factor GrpE [Rickettsiales bacterium]|jgi:molecular chaperone GrpE|nr:nucleotide exchange factor GrpE [Rickettsiales bacterium]